MSPTNATESLFTVLRAISAVVRDGEATVAQLEVLMTLINLSGSEEKDVRQEDIGFKLKRRQSTVAKQLDKWVDCGVLTKHMSPDSERERIYQLTRDGRRLISEIEASLKG